MPKLTLDQKYIYDRIKQNINNGVVEIFFINSLGWNGKKNVILRLILAEIRFENNIPVALAWSGIVARLLPAIKKLLIVPCHCHWAWDSLTHQRITFPNHLTWETFCIYANLLFWMNAKLWLKITRFFSLIIARSRENIRHFADAVICFAGDLWQTVHLIPQKTPTDEINAGLK